MKYSNALRSVLVAGLLLSSSLIASPAADADSLSASISIGSGCVGAVNGASSVTMNVTAGSDVNLTVFNSDTVAAQNVSGPGTANGAQLQKNSKTTGGSTQTFQLGVVSSQTVVRFTPVPTDYTEPVYINFCPINATPAASTLIINPIAAAAPVTTPAPAPTKKTIPAAATPAPTARPSTEQDYTSQAVTPIDEQSFKNSPDAPKNTAVYERAGIFAVIVIIIALLIAARLGYLPYRKPLDRIR